MVIVASRHGWWIGLIGLLAGCASRDATLQNPGEKPSIYYIKCKQSIRGCQSSAKQVCRGTYDVIKASGENPSADYLSSMDSSQYAERPPDADKNWKGEMLVACHDGPDGPAPRAPKKYAVAPAPAASAAAPAPDAVPAPKALPDGMLCIPGVTQECLGPAACRGGQACSADGKSYGPCDCGTPTPAAPTPSAPSP